MSLLLLLGLAACGNGTPLVAYKSSVDAIASILPLSIIGIYACADATVMDGVEVIQGRPFDQCYRMQPQRRFRGIWLDQFEGSAFFENAVDADAVKQQIVRECSSRNVKREWLSYSDERLTPDGSGEARLVAMDFIGRQTAYDGSYGHFGSSGSLVLVDRVIAAHPVYVSPQPYIEYEFSHCNQQ